MEKISLLEMKMTSDKKLFKEERKKCKQLSKQLSELQSKNWNENDETIECYQLEVYTPENDDEIISKGYIWFEIELGLKF